MSFNKISKFETAMKEHEDIINTEIDTEIDNLKSEAYSSINKKFHNQNPNNSPYSSNQTSADINK